MRAPLTWLFVGVLLGTAGCGTSDGHRWATPTRSAASPTVATDPASPSPAQSASGPVPATGAVCTLFPADNVWHADVSRLPVHPASGAYVSSIGAARTAHPDFGSGLIDGAPFGIPITTVPAGQAKVPVSFEYAAESDRWPVPRAPGRGDRGRPECRRGPACDRVRPGRLHRVRAVQRPPDVGRLVAGRLRSRVRPASQPAAARRVDLGGRRRTADHRGSAALRRGRRWPGRPCDPADCPPYPQHLSLAGAARRLVAERPEPTADGTAAAA